MMLKTWEMLYEINKMMFSIHLAGHRICEPDWRRKPRPRHFYSIWMISKGRGDFVIDGNQYLAEPGKIFVIVPGAHFEAVTDPVDCLEYYFIRYSWAYAYEERDQWVFANSDGEHFPLEGMYTMQSPPEVLNLFEQMFELWKRRGATVTVRRKILMYELFLAIIRDLRAQKVAGNTTLAIENTIDYMVDHYHRQLTLQDLAQIAGLSVSHYSRLFKKYAGYSPIDYLTHLRMDRAKELLVLSDYRLKGIAKSVGYNDEFYFSRIFKKVVGLSPSEFAKKNRYKLPR